MTERHSGLEVAHDLQPGMERSPYAGNGDIQLKEHRYQQAHAYISPDGQQTRQERRICKLTRRTFWLVLIIAILLLLVVVAAAVGGSIAASRSHSSPQSSSTTTPTRTASSTNAPPTSSTTQIQSTATSTPPVCPSSNGTVYNSPIGGSFNIKCGFDYPGNSSDTADGIDMHNLKTTSLQGCIDACASWTAIGVEGGNCLIATWVELFQSCYLKNSTNMAPLLSSAPDIKDSAVLGPSRG